MAVYLCLLCSGYREMQLVKSCVASQADTGKQTLGGFCHTNEHTIFLLLHCHSCNMRPIQLKPKLVHFQPFTNSDKGKWQMPCNKMEIIMRNEASHSFPPFILFYPFPFYSAFAYRMITSRYYDNDPIRYFLLHSHSHFAIGCLYTRLLCLRE